MRHTTPASSFDALTKIGDLAAGAGIRRIHLLAWRDLDDAEAGGSEIHAAEVARHWAAAGLDVTLRTSHAVGHPTTTRRDGYRVVRRAGRYAVFPRAVGSELLGRHGQRDALVEIWNGVPFLSPIWARGPRVVFLHHLHRPMWRLVLADNPMLARAGETFERRIAPRFYHRTPIVTLSESSRHELVHELGLPPHGVRVVPPGVDPRFRPGGRKSPRPLVVAVSRLMAPKRFDVVIRAAVQARRRCPDLELIIVGKGEERERLEQLAHDLDAQDWITFAGYLSDEELVALYQRAWLLTNASIAEGWGMSVTEAAACGTPAVVSDIAGHRDAVDAGRSGILAADERALAAGIESLVVDEQLRTRLSEGARTRAASLTWEATAIGTLAALADSTRRRAVPTR